MKRILVVDDDQDSCELLREIFSVEGWHVDTALTPSQAFTVAEKEKIDLIVSDVNLEANQSGLDLFEKLALAVSGHSRNRVWNFELSGRSGARRRLGFYLQAV